MDKGSLTHSQLLEGLKSESKYKTTKGGKIGACSLVHKTLRGRGACWSSGMGLRRIDKLHSLTHAHTTHIKWLVHSWSSFGARTSHGQHGHTRLTTTRTLGKPPPSPLIVYFGPLHRAYIQMAFLSRTNLDSHDFRAP